MIVVSLLVLYLVHQAVKDVAILCGPLHHLHPLPAHLQHSGVRLQLPGLLIAEVVQQQPVHSNEGPGATHARAAVDQDRVCREQKLTCLQICDFTFLRGVNLPGLVDEVAHEAGVVRRGEVGPLQRLQLGHLHHRTVGPAQLQPPVVDCTLENCVINQPNLTPYKRYN